MKIVFLTLALFVLLPASLEGQYRVNKNTYSVHDYKYHKGDPLPPAVAGVASFFVPGLGQVLSGEYLRGASFFGGYAGFTMVYTSGAVRAKKNIWKANKDDEGFLQMLVGMGGMVSVQIWSAVDALKVSKINNLSFRDKHNHSYTMSLEPYSRNIKMDITTFRETGLTFKMEF